MLLQILAAFSSAPSENEAFKGTSASPPLLLQGAPGTVSGISRKLRHWGKKKNLKLYINPVWAEHVQFPGLCLAGTGNNKMIKYLGSLHEHWATVWLPRQQSKALLENRQQGGGFWQLVLIHKAPKRVMNTCFLSPLPQT